MASKEEGGGDGEINLDGATCDERAKKFAELTQTDEACAHFFLQDCEWNLENALESFFKQSEGESSKSPNEASTDRSFKFLTWNIDGLDDKNLETRTKAVCTIIIKEKPDVVFLQEVIEETWAIIASYLSDEYDIFCGKDSASPIPYFTLSLLRRCRLKCRKESVIPFDSSMMGRTLLTLTAQIGDDQVTLINTHLESMADHANERKKQLKKTLDVMRDALPGVTVILAGDLNARDKEFDEVGGLPERVRDVWVENGRRKFTEFTWDCAKNDNKEFPKFKPRCRFDRILYTSDGEFNSSGDLKFVGMDRIKNIHCFPSDHWGLLTQFAPKK